MTQGIGYTVGAGLAAGQPPAAKVALEDVGRDPYFLTALTGGSAAGDQAAGAGALAAPSADIPHGNAVSLHLTADAMTRAPVITATPASAYTHAALGERTNSNAALASAAPDKQAPSGSAPFSTRMMQPAWVPGAQTTRALSSPAGSITPWLPQNITLSETASGVDVIARNFFLDDSGRRQWATRILQDIAAAGKTPRQITLNGEVIWRSPVTEPHAKPAGST